METSLLPLTFLPSYSSLRSNCELFLKAVWRKKRSAALRKAMLCIKQKQGEAIRKISSDLDGCGVELSELAGCEVLLLDASDMVEADTLTDTRIVVGACSGTVTVRNCSGCTIAACCTGLIVKDSPGCTFYVYVLTFHLQLCQPPNFFFSCFLNIVAAPLSTTVYFL